MFTVALVIQFFLGVRLVARLDREVFYSPCETLLNTIYLSVNEIRCHEFPEVSRSQFG